MVKTETEKNPTNGACVATETAVGVALRGGSFRVSDSNWSRVTRVEKTTTASSSSSSLFDNVHDVLIFSFRFGSERTRTTSDSIHSIPLIDSVGADWLVVN